MAPDSCGPWPAAAACWAAAARTSWSWRLAAEPAAELSPAARRSLAGAAGHLNLGTPMRPSWGTPGTAPPGTCCSIPAGIPGSPPTSTPPPPTPSTAATNRARVRGWRQGRCADTRRPAVACSAMTVGKCRNGVDGVTKHRKC